MAKISVYKTQEHWDVPADQVHKQGVSGDIKKAAFRSI